MYAGTDVKDLSAKSLLPFVPSGKNYDASRRLFADLGFEEVWENNGYAGFRNGGAEFILQRFDDDHFAQNFMVRLNVDDWIGGGRPFREKASIEPTRVSGSLVP